MNEKQSGHFINLSAMWRVVGEASRKPIQLNAMDWASESLPLALSRKFNQPSNLEADSGIFLELVGLPAGTAVGINGQSLGCCGVAKSEFEVTKLIVVGQNVIELMVAELVLGEMEELASRVRLKLI